MSRTRRFGSTALGLAFCGLLFPGCGQAEEGSASSWAKRPAPTLPPAWDGLSPEIWAARLAEADVGTRRQALGALAEMGLASAPHADAVAACLADASADVRWGALQVVGRLGEAAASQAVPVLARLDDPSPGVRRAAAAAAGRLGPTVAPALAARIGLPDAEARTLARRALEALGADGAAVAPALGRLLRGEDDSVAEDAAEALAAMGAAAVPELSDSLADDRGLVVVLAAGALARIGPEAKDALPALGRALRRRGDARRAAAEALVAVGAAARPVLEEATKDPDENVREAATEALSRLR